MLAVGLLLSLAATYLAQKYVDQEEQLRFEGTVSDWPEAIEARIRAYADILLGIRGMYLATDSVSRAQFKRYVESLDLSRRYPGVQVIHYGERIGGAQRPQFERDVRTDTSIDPRGYPHFAIKPPGARAEYVVVRYVEPMAGNEAALGLDLAGDPVRLAALVRTRDSGQLTASGVIALAHDPKRHPGIAMRVPVYQPGRPVDTVEQRREAFIGVISASFVVIDLMRGLFGEHLLQTVRILIHDAGYVDSATAPDPPSPANLMFDSNRLLSSPAVTGSAPAQQASRLVRTAKLDIGGRRWNLSFTASAPFADPSTRWLPATALLGGGVITLLLFGLTRSLATSGSRAINLANRITEDLRRSEASLAEAQRMTQQLIEVLPNPIFFKDTDGRYIGVNRAWESYFGISRSAFIGKTVFDLYPDNRDVAERLDAMDQALWRSPGSQTYETTITTPDGRHHEAIYYKATFSRSDGTVAGLIGTIVDITERKEAEARYRATFESAPVGIMHTAIDGDRILHANPKLCAMLGYAEAELLAMTTDQTLAPEQRGADRPVYREKMLNGELNSYSSERKYLRKDGSSLWVNRTVALARDANGTPLYFIRIIEDISERKAATERYRATFDNAPIGIMHVGLDRKILHVNPKLCQIIGYEEPELIGRPVDDVVHPDLRNTDRRAYTEDMLSGKIQFYSSERVYLRKDGTPVPVNRTISLVRDAAGQPLYFVRIIEDISERKELERRFRETFDQAAVGIVHTSFEGKYLRVNQKFCEMLGYTESELVGREAAAFTHPEDRERGRHSRQLMWEGKLRNFIEEKRYVRKDGSVIWTNRTVSLARDASGNPMYFIRVIEDVTERKEIEERYRATFDNAPVGIMHTEVDTYRILRANRKLAEMLGYSQEELLGMTSTDVVHPDYRFSDRSKYMAPMLSDHTQSFASERKFLRKDGSSLWVNRTVSLVKDAAGNPLYFIRIVEDISERKQAEEVLVRERALLRAIIDTVPDFIYVKDVHGSFQLANKAWLDARNLRREDIVGKTTFDIFPPELAKSTALQDAEIIRTGISMFEKEQAIILRTADGLGTDIKWAAVTKVPMKDAAGRIIGTVGISRDITERKLSAQRREMEHAVTRVLAEAQSLAEAIPKIIETICETMGWICGSRWEMDREAGLLRCRETWGIDTPEVKEFVAATRERAVEPLPVGQGLVRRTFAARKPVWIADIARDDEFRRRALAEKAGLHGAFGFPLLGGNEVLGVMEFFHCDVRKPDEMLIQIAQSIGSQIGQCIVRMQAEEALKFVATHDALTGLPNRIMFNQRLTHALAQAHRYDRRLAVIFIDLDRFKIINDTLGHESGDVLLREVSKRLTASLRAADTVARFGGDEFVVLVEEVTDPLDLAGVAEKLITTLSGSFPLSGQEYHVTASIGVATYPDDGTDIQTLLKNADIAMYRAKDQGRNAFQFYSAQLNVHSLERLSLESGLRRALERHEFVLHYQPQVDIRHGHITGMEALIRWQHPELGLLAPNRFIHIAEETGLIVPIGEWVLYTAGHTQREWQRLGFTAIRVAVNLSPRQFVHGELVQGVMRTLKEACCDPNCIELEITESMLMHNPERAVEIINQLKALGLHVAIDDFGTGYSSLAYLKRFPIDSLKIDRSFITDLPGDKGDAAITHAVIVMAHSLGLKVIAEGVETREQFNFLRKHRCDEMQGYYFSAALPMDQATSLLRQRYVSNA